MISETKDGEIVDIQPKSLGTTELFPLAIKFSPNGHHFSVISDKDFVVSTSRVYRSSCVGSGTDFGWVSENDFVVKDEKTVRLYKNFKEYKSFKTGFSFENVFGGPYFSVKTSDAVFIYDFETTMFIRKIDVSPHTLVWSENKKNLALICDDVTYILRAFPDRIEKFIEDNDTADVDPDDGGCETAFEGFYEINERVMNGFFIDEVFIFVNNKNKINYALEDRIFSITTLNSNYSLQGYLASLNKIFLMNKSFNLIAYTFPLSFVNYQTAILKRDFANAEKILSTIPEEYFERVTNFLEKFEMYELCYKICTNPNQKFSLAIKLKKLNDARMLALEQNSSEKWKLVADLAFELGEFKHAEEAMMAAKDYTGLLLYYSIICDREKYYLLAETAENDGFYNIAFTCYFKLNDLERALEILVKSGKYPEASLFCRTYYPSKLASVLDLWNTEINNEEVNNRISKFLKIKHRCQSHQSFRKPR
jgi:coatomer subunit beta'